MRTTGAAVPHRRLLGLLRLADRGSNGFPAERQLALDKALAIARDNAIALDRIIRAHRFDVTDLRRTPWRSGQNPAPPPPCASPVPRRGQYSLLRPPSREECGGVYPVADFRSHAGPAHADLMAEGDPVRLMATGGHPAGRFTVVVTWRDIDIGLIPPGRSVAIWRRRWRRPSRASTRAPTGRSR